MRRTIYLGQTETGRSLFRRAEVAHFVGLSLEGTPVLKVLHPVVVDGYVAFHSAAEGEKVTTFRGPCVVSVHESVVTIPSYFSHPERACPATTYYLSAQVQGPVEVVRDPDCKASVLTAMMAKFQSEGGHRPIAAADPIYRTALERLAIFRVSMDALACKTKLAQNLAPQKRTALLEKLWRRGHAGDLRAVELILSANPDTPVPPFLRAPEGLRLRCHLSADRAIDAARLVESEYWNKGVDRSAIVHSHENSPAWVGIEDDSGRLIGTARAVGDSVRHALILDVGIDSAWRGRGLGGRLLTLLLDHPVLRSTQRVLLRTKDAQTFYAKYGFSDAVDTIRLRSTEMLLTRRAAENCGSEPNSACRSIG